MGYCTRAELYAEGLPRPADGGPKRDRVDDIIEYVSGLIDEWTGWWFDRRDLVLTLDGDGETDALYFPAPIVEITEIARIDQAGVIQEVVDPESYFTYARHLTGMTDPDDRRAARVEMNQDYPYPNYPRLLYSRWYVYGGQYVWERGQKNFRVTGTFGYQDYDPTDPLGKTPLAIKQLAILLVLRYVWPRYSYADETEAADRGRITSEKTRDQAWQRKYPWTEAGQSGTGIGAWTGDPEIDRLISSYSKPFGIAMV